MKVVFLDRDGAINVDRGYVYKKEDWEFTKRAPQALQKLQAAGYRLGVITNQSGIREGYYTVDDMHHLHAFMQQQLAVDNVHIDAIAWCPHGRESRCNCRKPNDGMARMIEQQLGRIDYADSWTVGDKEADVAFGKKAGTKTALIKSRYWQADQLQQQPDIIVDSLWQFAVTVTSNE